MFVMPTPCLGCGMLWKRALLMGYEGVVLPYIWLKCCIVPFCLQAQIEDNQMCQCLLFISFVTQFQFILWAKKVVVKISHCTQSFLKKTRCPELDL